MITASAVSSRPRSCKSCLVGLIVNPAIISLLSPRAAYLPNGTARGGRRGRRWFEVMKTFHLSEIIEGAKKIAGAVKAQKRRELPGILGKFFAAVCSLHQASMRSTHSARGGRYSRSRRRYRMVPNGCWLDGNDRRRTCPFWRDSSPRRRYQKRPPSPWGRPRRYPFCAWCKCRTPCGSPDSETSAEPQTR